MPKCSNNEKSLLGFSSPLTIRQTLSFESSKQYINFLLSTYHPKSNENKQSKEYIVTPKKDKTNIRTGRYEYDELSSL